MPTDQQLERLPPEPESDLPTTPRRAVVLGLCALGVGWSITHWLTHRGELQIVGVVGAPATAVAAPVDGRLIEQMATEHDVVDARGALAVIDDSRHVALIEAQRGRVKQLQDTLIEAEARADVDLAWRQKELRGEIHQTQIEASNLLKQKLTRDVEQLAWGDFQRYGASSIQLTSTEKLFLSLHNQQFRSEEEQLRAALKEEASRNAAEVLNAQIELCDQRLAELRGLQKQLPEKIRQASGLNRIRAQLTAAEEKLSRLEMQPKRVTVSASNYGVVGVYRIPVGKDVTRGETIVELLDLDQPFLVANVPSIHLHRFSLNGQVNLQFPGQIERTGRVTGIPPQTNLGDSSSGDADVAIHIEPTGKLWPRVPVGSTVQIRVGVE